MSLVEYYDPDNVFDAVAPDIYRRLPLTNLHWKSSVRPLRSIESLHVDFVRAGDSTAKDAVLNKKSPVSLDGGERPKQVAPTRAQRHQIPGLRQTPYLKLFLLRCDDKETYKSESKNVLREWMSENVSTSASAGNTQDNHDAFEWLILHVVLPNTSAACEPRWSKKSTTTDEQIPKEKSSSTTRWTGKSSRTILERLRADFNQSGKSSLDRIAQIRLAKESVPERMILSEPPDGATQLQETPREHENACDDLISKMKILILRSFDLRVRQYEDDINEKEHQQSLPGWNFCTFFVLKEGLARAFESVGLVDDALAVYDELDAGLDTSLRDRAFGANDGQSTTFLPFTQELHDSVVAASNCEASRPSENEGISIETPLPLTLAEKDYRALIVANDISVFDFRCYLFARAMSLLIRLANIRSSQYSTHANGTVSSQDLPGKREPTTSAGTVQNAIALAELCRRAVQFVPSIARILRVDLRAGFDTEGANVKDMESTIDKVVLSVTFAVAQQILDETATSDIAAALPSHKENGNDTSKRLERRSGRRSSLPSTAASGKGQLFATDASILYSHGLKSITPIQNPELANIAAYRAELCLLQRRALESIGKQFHLYIGRNEKGNDESPAAEAKSEGEISDAHSLLYLSTVQLRRSLSSAEEFSKLYEALTDRAALHYAIANRTKSAEKLAADIAKLKLAEGDYAAAALYFSQIVPSFSVQSWNSIETSILQLYSECLKALHRKDDYVRVSLALLKKVAEAKGPQPGRKSTQRARPIPRYIKTRLNGMVDAPEIYDDLFPQLVEFANDLPYDFNSPFDVFITNLQFDSSIKSFIEHDGFKLRLTVQQVLANRVTFDRITVKLVNPVDSQAREVLLENAEAIELGYENSEIWLQCHANVVGRVIVDKVTFHAGKLAFVYEALERKEPQSLLNLSSDATETRPRSTKISPMLLFQRAGALFADINSSKTTHIGQNKTVDVIMETGSNEIEHATLVLRSATAGLRIHCGGAVVINGQALILDKDQPGKIKLDSLKTSSEVCIQVPYELERNVAELSLRLEVHYTTAHGTFVFTSSPTVPIELPLDINVQDVFKEEFLYSKFLVQPQNSIPVHLLQAELSSSELYHSEPLLRRFDPFLVFPHQPANIAFRISKKDHPNVSGGKGFDKPSLLLTVSYRSLHDDIISQLSSKFRINVHDSTFSHLQRHLLQTLKKSLLLHFHVDDYQYSSMTGEFNLPAFNSKFWTDVLDGLSEADRHGLHHWLERWHTENKTIVINNPGDPEYNNDPSSRHQILIDFELPHLPYLHTTSLALVSLPPHPHHNDKPSTQPPVARVGEPLHVRLHTRYTRRWDLHPSRQEGRPSTGIGIVKSKTTSEAKAIEEQFTYEIYADPGDWLVIGPRRVRFTAAPSKDVGVGDADGDDDEESEGGRESDDEDGDQDVIRRSRSFDLFLVPVRTGRLFLPHVEVLLVRETSAGQSPEQGRNSSQKVRRSERDSAAADEEDAPAGKMGGLHTTGNNNNNYTHNNDNNNNNNNENNDNNISSQTDCTSVHTGIDVIEGMQRTTVGIGAGEELAHGVVLLSGEI